MQQIQTLQSPTKREPKAVMIYVPTPPLQDKRRLRRPKQKQNADLPCRKIESIPQTAMEGLPLLPQGIRKVVVSDHRPPPDRSDPLPPFEGACIIKLDCLIAEALITTNWTVKSLTPSSWW
jgi:hypothetical protein